MVKVYYIVNLGPDRRFIPDGPEMSQILHDNFQHSAEVPVLYVVYDWFGETGHGLYR